MTRRAIARLVAALAVIVMLGFVVRALALRWDALSRYALSPDPAWLALSFGLLLLHSLLIASLYWLVLARLGARLPLLVLLRIYFAVGLSRYLPRKLWPLAGRAILCEREGVRPAVSAVALLLETALNLTAALACFGLSAPLWPRGAELGDLTGRLAWWAWLAVPAALALVHPRPLGALLGWVSRRLGKPAEAVPFAYRTALGLLALYAALWLLLGAAFCAFTRAFTPFAAASAAPIAGAFALAWALGTLSLLPGGLGAREWTLATLLEPLIGALAAPVGLAARLWTVVAELLLAGILVGSARFGARASRRPR